MPDNPLAGAVCSVAEARGYVAFGAGVYRVCQTVEPGLVVTFRRPGEEDRAVSERAEAPDLTPIPPEDMIVRLQFTSAAGLDSLEDHLREIRAEHWPETAGGQSAKQWLDQRKGAASKEWMAGWDACRAAGQAFQAPEGGQLAEVWEANSKTGTMLFHTRAEANAWVSQFAPSIAGGFTVQPRTVYHYPAAPAPSPAEAHGDERAAFDALLNAMTKIVNGCKDVSALGIDPDELRVVMVKARAALAHPQPKGIPVAWSRQQFIHDDDGYSIGTDEPELHWGKEPPDDETSWHPLYAAAGVTTRDAALEEAAQLCERWNTTPGRKLAGEIRALAAQAPAPGDGEYKQALGSKNCMQSAVAYMLGLPMDAVPDFEKAGPGAWESFYAFISERGFTAEMFPPNVEIDGDYLASGSTERGTSHMVVMRGGELLHDPHPSNAGLTSPQVVWVIARKAGPSPAVAHTQAARDVLAERQRQVTAEGWTPEHDEQHREGELCLAAAGYAHAASDALQAIEHEFDAPGAPTLSDPVTWSYGLPWPTGWDFKPAPPRRQLVKAAALLLAEVERLDRASQPPVQKTGGGNV